mgnify:FL=1
MSEMDGESASGEEGVYSGSRMREKESRSGGINNYFAELAECES